ncbi:ethanolamine ammonia-lyase subunit EutC [uncultured Zhongshania sp.]|uniref:ethanolamine ammonia-lyase subunit EutC n=1 Tax=uncultured Zhongshania sp. TaxID=1642288 RepID=UPI0030D7E321|tara:strand:+ start:2260 stop:3063 length:804 start_codon:yes stop_codon:yes gene_type:complete
MSDTKKDSWHDLQAYTSARIAQGRSGVSLPIAANLKFQLDHARARDAVHTAFNIHSFIDSYLAAYPSAAAPLCVASAAESRGQYLQRPDLGRQLPEAQWQQLRQSLKSECGSDIAVVVADGLSSAAVQRHALPLLALLLPAIATQGFSLAPLCIATQARVALGDDIGEAIKAKLLVMLIGERPGLSSPDSLGMYITYAPQRACTDAQRNCISNIRDGGLSYQQACDTGIYLIATAMKKAQTGVSLKDESMLLDSQTATAIPFFKTSA